MTAICAVPSRSFLAAFLPVVQASLLPQASSGTGYLARKLSLSQRLRSSLLPAALIPIPSFLGSLWDGILKAVPKKKTSHAKKRHRLLDGKALKDVTALNKCSACGRLKRAHILCPYCVLSIRQWMGNGFQSKGEVQESKDKSLEKLNEQLRSLGQETLEKPKKL